MLRLFKEEFSALAQFFRQNGTETVVISSSALFLVLWKYRPIGSDWLSALLYYAVFPILVILIFLRKNPLNFGLKWTSPRLWWFPTLLICIVAGLLLLASSSSPALQSYYQDKDFNIVAYILASCVSLGAQEFFYRGFLLFGLKEKFKEGSIFLQMVPFVLMHLGKPELETISTIITGILFGYVCYRGKSFWPAFIIHMFINVFFVGYINLRYPLAA